MAQFNLRCELVGHEEDVRCVCTHDLGIGQTALVTGSRDKTIKVWKEEPNNSFSLDTTLVGHKDYVTALTSAMVGDITSVVSASRDTSARAWDHATASPIITMEGHEYQLTDIAVTADGTIYTASLDKTVRMWGKDGKCVKTLPHEGPVLSLVALDDGSVLSGSGDCTIRQWRDGEQVRAIKGHTDTVRALTALPNIGFVSASHDMSIKVWSLDGTQLGECTGHTAIIYAVAASADGTMLASGSEDGTLKIWRPTGELLQTIAHPGCVWDVAWLPNGDVLSACSDHVARVFTASPVREASEASMAAFEAAVKARADAASGQDAGTAAGGLPEGLNVEEATALLAPGKSAGDLKFIREDAGVMAYSWDPSAMTWNAVGTVTTKPDDDANMAVGGKWFKGQEWDYVFDVDIAEGAPTLKLPMNRGDNAYAVADKFLEEHDLPVTYRDQIVQFIFQNTAQDALAAGPAQVYDPFTGAGAYQPGQAPAAPLPSGNTGVTGGGFDPFTGGGSSAPVTGGGFDPFTGGSSSVPSSAPAAAPADDKTLTCCPVTSAMSFTAKPKPEAMAKKLRELASGVPADVALNETEAGPALDSLLALAASGGGALSAEQSALLAKMLSWPAEATFPVLDAMRLLILHNDTAAEVAAALGPLDASAGGLSSLLARLLADGHDNDALRPALQTALKLLCNMAAVPRLAPWVTAQRSALLEGVARCSGSSHKAVRNGYATLALNMAVLILGLPQGDEEAKTMILSGMTELLVGTPADETETVARAFAAVGTVCKGDAAARELATGLELLSGAQRSCEGGATGRVADVARDVVRILTHNL